MRITALTVAAVILLSGCSLKTNEERQIEKTVDDFMQAVTRGDDTAAKDVLLDLGGFRTLNPDVSARVDADSFTDAVLSDLLTNYRQMASMFGGKGIKVTAVTLGGQWYQYKGFPAFKDNTVEMKVDGEVVNFIIRGLVRIGDKWRIVDLSDNGLF